MNSATELLTHFFTAESRLSLRHHTKLEQITRTSSLAIVISELIKGYVHD